MSDLPDVGLRPWYLSGPGRDLISMPSNPSVPAEGEPNRQMSEEVLAALRTDSEAGLSQAEAEGRLTRYGRTSPS